MCVKPAGVAWSERASKLDLHRIGQLRSSTITFSWVTATSPSYREAFWLTSQRGAVLPVPTRSVKDVDLVTVRVNYRFGGPVIPKY